MKQIYGQNLQKLTNGSVASVNTIGGETVAVLGQITIPVKINDIIHHSQFHIMRDLPYEVILGQNFLHENEAVINLRDNYLTLRGKSIKLKKMLDAMRVVAAYAFPSSTSSATTETKKVQLTASSGKRTNLHPKSTNTFWKPSFWISILVMYLCVSSHTQSQAKMQPDKKITTRHECYHIKQIEVKAAADVFIKTGEHDCESMSKKFAHNWRDHNNTVDVESTSLKLPKVAQNSYMCAPFSVGNDKATEERKVPKTGEISVEETGRTRIYPLCRSSSLLIELINEHGIRPFEYMKF